MKRKFDFYVIFFLISSIAICFAKGIGFCLEINPPKEMNQISKKNIRRVSILPMVNLSGSDVTAPDVIARIEDYLGSKRNIEVVPREIGEGFLEKERIRDIGLLSRATSRTIGNALKVDGIVLTCVNLLTAGDNPMIGIGCRMVDGRDGSLIWYNHVSLAGSDYTSWFGLLKVTSLEDLATKAVERLLSTFPIDVKIMHEDIDSFEITEISANPKYIRPHEEIHVRVKFVSMGRTIKKVDAILGSQKSPLVIEEDLVYRGTLQSPNEEGKHLLNLEALDEKNDVSIFDSVGIIKVDDTPPNVALYSRDELFSPNGDRIKDMVIFSPYLREPDNIESWEFVVENSNDEVIRRAEGKNPLPESLVWRGEDDFYSSVLDGKYYGSLKVIDQAGNETTTPRREIILDKTPPDVQIVFDIMDERGFQFYVECEDVNGIDRWQLTILDPDQRVIQSFEGDGNAPSTLLWETDPSVHTESSYSFKAKDLAGNTIVLHQQPFKAEFLKKDESSSKEKKKRKDWDYDF